MKACRTTISVLSAACLLTLSGCASIVGNSQYPVAVKSTPAGASFTIKNRSGEVVHTGTTPGTVTLKSGSGYFKGEAYTVTFHKDGYADTTTQLSSSMSGWYWGNILFGGLIGMLIVDPLTGAMYKLPDSSNGDLGAPVMAKNTGQDLTMLTIDQVPADQRLKLIRVN
ncbi:hypothetical protein [Pseudomonas oryzihabitans]|uniref:hypothetical protein n=1 Tax=Pseudomonas oryzihabitans TaxID=47885 RepID=UPI0011A0240F|nr:hypothetical protein [Pseudomonas oryzihabitans]